jgi:hypothetical protein
MRSIATAAMSSAIGVGVGVGIAWMPIRSGDVPVLIASLAIALLASAVFSSLMTAYFLGAPDPYIEADRERREDEESRL